MDHGTKRPQNRKSECTVELSGGSHAGTSPSFNVAHSNGYFPHCISSAFSGASPGSCQEKEKKEITIKTPWGGFEATSTADPSRLGLPLYPGANFVNNEAPGSLAVGLSIRGKPDIRFFVGKFQTPDSPLKVRDFYQKKLGKDVTKFTEKTDDGSMAFEIKGKLVSKYVGLKTVDEVTEIDLVRIDGLQNNDE